MLRILPGVIAAAAMAAMSMAVAPAAYAQIEVEKEVDRTSVPLVQADSARGLAAAACSKVKYAFVCRDGNRGSGTAACRRGETVAQCCARMKKKVAQACRRHGGLARFKCACTKKKGGKDPAAAIRRVSPDTIDPASAAESQSGTARARAGTVLEEIEVEKEVDKTSVPLVQADSARGRAAKACRKVKYAFVCRDGNRGSGTAACRGGETEAQCCARIRNTVAQACRRHGGLAKFKCACSHPGGAPGGLLAPGEQGSGKSGHKGGNVEFEWKVEEGESAPPAKPGIRSPGTPILKRTACDEVSFAYRCKRRDPQKSGRRACARNQTEAECCDAAHSRVMRECGGVPAQWKCRCTN